MALAGGSKEWEQGPRPWHTLPRRDAHEQPTAWGRWGVRAWASMRVGHIASGRQPSAARQARHGRARSWLAVGLAALSCSATRGRLAPLSRHRARAAHKRLSCLPGSLVPPCMHARRFLPWLGARRQGTPPPRGKEEGGELPYASREEDKCKHVWERSGVCSSVVLSGAGLHWLAGAGPLVLKTCSFPPSTGDVFTARACCCFCVSPYCVSPCIV